MSELLREGVKNFESEKVGVQVSDGDVLCFSLDANSADSLEIL